jgi:lactate dehydrogenase-like 2-hydroxyacid dehydrogenase
MKKPTALYYRILKYQPQNLALLVRYFDLVELENPTHDTAGILAKTDALFAPLGFSVDAAKIEACPRLKVILSNTTGIPHIDALAAADRNVTICALNDEQVFLDGITPTAEHTIGLMIAAWRSIPAAHAETCRGVWDRRPWGAPAMMSRMRLGIVGYGRLGKKVAKIARAIGMQVNYFDPAVAGGLPDLLQLASQSDILSLHAVGNEQTRHLVSRVVLEALPRGAMVVNTARGEVLDTNALIDLLESGHLYCAALDTVDGEYGVNFSEHFANSRLARYARTHNNLLLTPHIGGSTIDAWGETESRVVQKAIHALGLKIVC